MKANLHFITTFLALVISIFTFAQPTLTDANCNPFAGDVFTVAITSTASAGNAGANQTWNLSSVTTSTNYFVSMTAFTSSSSLYPSANVAYQNGTSLYIYYKTSTSSLQNYGNHYYAGSFPGTVITTYTNPMDQMHLPCNFNDTYTDAYSGSINSTGTIPYQITFGTVTVTADGYGTLIVPSRTITNVMRVRTTTYGRDSIPNNGWGAYYTIDKYDWYVTGTHYPVASMGSGSGSYITNYPAGLNDNSSLNNIYELYPVPADDKLSIVLTNRGERSTIYIYTALGQKLTVPDQTIAQNKIEINTSDFPSGVYILQVVDHGITASKRFVISR